MHKAFGVLSSSSCYGYRKPSFGNQSQKVAKFTKHFAIAHKFGMLFLWCMFSMWERLENRWGCHSLFSWTSRGSFSVWVSFVFLLSLLLCLQLLSLTGTLWTQWDSQIKITLPRPLVNLLLGFQMPSLTKPWFVNCPFVLTHLFKFCLSVFPGFVSA